MRRRRHRASGDVIDGVTTLATVARDERVRVLRVSGRPHLMMRLATLGVVPGVQLTVIKPQGPAIVSLGGARIAIGRGAAQSVVVEAAVE